MNETPAARFTAADLPTLEQLQMLQSEERRGREQPTERQEEIQQNTTVAPRVFFYADAPSSEQLRTIQQELGGTAGPAPEPDIGSPALSNAVQQDVRAEERERKEREKKARLAAKQAERERKAQEEKARIAARQAERERIDREIARLAAEQEERERKEQERKARLAAEQAERERVEKEIARLAAEQAERERREREEIARIAAEQAERERVEREIARLAAEQAERERREREEQARLAAQEAERKRKAREEKKRIAAELTERSRREREEKARLAAEQAERERREREEKARLAAEQAERERKEREEQARLAAEQAERERKEREEQARLAAERAERERREREEQARLAAEQAERERRERKEKARAARKHSSMQNAAPAQAAKYAAKPSDSPKTMQQVRSEPAKGTLSANAMPIVKKAKAAPQPIMFASVKPEQAAAEATPAQPKQSAQAEKRAPAPAPSASGEEQRFTAYDFAAEIRRKRMQENGYSITEEDFHNLRDNPEILEIKPEPENETATPAPTETPETPAEESHETAKPVEGLPTAEQYQKQLRRQSGRRTRRAGEKPTDEQLQNAQKKIFYRRNFFRVLKNTVFTLITVSAVAVLIAVLLLPVLRIYGTSMTPTLDENNLVLSIKGSKFETGDVIAFYYNNKILVKRVIARSGEWVNIEQDGTVSVNGKIIDEPYISGKAFGECDIELPYQVPEGRVFVMGDHRDVSIDSRNTSIGCVAEEQIVGKIVYCIWPFKSIGAVE